VRKPLDAILTQIDQAATDLQSYRPESLDWVERAKFAATSLVPWLESQAKPLKVYVEDVLNAPLKLRRVWADIRPQLGLSKKAIKEFDRLLTLDDVLREAVTGEIVSKVVTKHLLDQRPDLGGNGRSDYPDVYLTGVDYAGLPVFRRRRANPDDEYGAALKGEHRRPVRVPDGLEIKTCRDSIRVDCHHPHAGLHLALVFSEAERWFTVDDVCVAFLRSSDYREAGRNTTATTVKYSFGSSRFISLLSG
jgi:hypothetical protein